MARLSDALFPGAHVFVPGFSGESALLLEELAADPERARDVHFTGVQYPGIGRGDYLSFHPTARQTGFFMLPAIREGLGRGQAELLPMDYAGIVRHLREAEPFDVVFAQLSPADAEGWCSPGICADFPPLVWSRARRRIGHINPRMPRTRSSFRVHLSELDASVEADLPLVSYREPSLSPADGRIGELVASLVRDGDTLQFGVGSIPTAVVRALTSHRRLRIFTGMVSNVFRELCEAGALDPDATILTGIAIGSDDFYRFISEQEGVLFADAGTTHDLASVARIERFIAINSAVEVDLFGQANSERVDGRILSGPGGLPVYARGALQAPGGRSLICLKSSAQGGAVSRIVPSLDARGLCTLPGHLADAVITEHGIAELRGRSLQDRARAMIAVAAPQHREGLERAWRDMLLRVCAT